MMITDDEYPLELTDRYLISTDVIGQGTMGTVYVGKRRVDRSVKVAIKAIRMADSDGPVRKLYLKQRMKREAEIMLKIKHANCVRMEYACYSANTQFVVMEYVEGGELFDRIVDEKNNGCGLGESLTKFYAWQLFNALEFLHYIGIVHRDVKPENILLLTSDTYTVAKLTDFGLSVASNHSLRTRCGTKCYMAPEMWSSHLKYDYKVDIWALGVVLFTCLCGYPPFSEEYLDRPLIEQIRSGRLVMCKTWENITESGHRFVRNCLCTEPNGRLSAKEALAECWLRDPIVEQSKEIIRNYNSEIYR